MNRIRLNPPPCGSPGPGTPRGQLASHVRRGAALLAALLAVLTLGACSAPEPVRLGFLGGLSGRGADLGEAGRNGAQLAVEQVNAAGGVSGRRVELLAFDDEQKPDQAIKGVQSLAEQGVKIIVGPMTSDMGLAIQPLLEQLDLHCVSPTITSKRSLADRSRLLSLAPSLDELSQRSADFLFARGARRIAIAYDLGNKAFSSDWKDLVRQRFIALGGTVEVEAGFQSGQAQGYAAPMRRMLASHPDALVFVANAVDTVRLTQLSRNLGSTLPVMTSTWAANDHLLRMGGRTVEGMSTARLIDSESRSPRYLAFATAFRARFGQEPGYASVAAYDAVNAILLAISSTDKASTFQQALLDNSTFDGLQQRWRFTPDGNVLRSATLSVVRDGRFAAAQ